MQANETSTPESPSVPVMLARTRKIPACLFSRDDLLRLYEQLNMKLQEEANDRVSSVRKLPQDTEQDFEAFKREIKDAYKISITINTMDGESLIGADRKVIDNISPDMEISSIFLSSKSRFEGRFNVPPKNHFSILLDFTKPQVFDLLNPVSQPTPNTSSFEVSGENDTWVRAVYDQIRSSFEAKKTKRSWLHRQGMYDLFLYPFVVPLIALILWRLSSVYDVLFPNSPIIADITAGGYGVLILGNLYRFIFAYTKWIFPVVELSDVGRGVPGGHRKFWWFLMIGILATVFATFFVPLG